MGLQHLPGVDIPIGDGYETKMYGLASLYSVEPVTEEAARMVAEQLYSTPIKPYEVPDTIKEAIRKNQITIEEKREALSHDGYGWR